MALIELDLTAPAEPAPSSPPPAHRYRLAGLLLAAVFLVALGGSAPVVPELWRELGSVPAPADPQMPFEVVDGRLYTFEPSGEADTIGTAWALDDEPRRLWSVRIVTDRTEPDGTPVRFGGAHVEHVGDLAVISSGPETMVVDAGSGAVRWSSPTLVTPLAGGRIGLVESEQFRPGTVYDQESGLPGPLYFSSAGVPHTEPPLRSDVRGVELSTGRTVWTAPSSGSVNMLPAPGGAPAVLIVSSAGIERRDGETGKVLGQVPLGRDGGPRPIGGELVGGQLLVYYSYESGFVQAYAPGTLAKLWSRVLPVPVIDPPNCYQVLCSGSRRALDVLDPLTGRPLWRAPEVDLAQRAGYLLEVGSTSGQPIRLVDPATGAARVDLRAWQAELTNPAPAVQPIVLRRVDQEQRSTVFGVVDPRRDEVQPLGRADRGLYDCSADAQHVVCRAVETLRIWAYRS